MVELQRLRVSLTKNGYQKVAAIIAAHPSHEVMDCIRDRYPGITLEKSQVANLLNADQRTGQLPAYWNDAREIGDSAVHALVCLSIIYGHHRLVRAFTDAAIENFDGILKRSQFPDAKSFTNLVLALHQFGLCQYERGAKSVPYDLLPLVATLQGYGGILVRRLLKDKLERCGWVDPSVFAHSSDDSLATTCKKLEFHRVVACEWEQFKDWIDGSLEADPPEIDLAANANLRLRHFRLVR